MFTSGFCARGTWNLKPACKKSTTGSSYVKIKNIFTVTSFEQTTSVYADSTCASLTLTLVTSGSYLTANLTSGTFEYQADLDLTLQALQITPNTSTLVSSYNSASYCGYNTWQLNVPKDIAGQNCDGSIIPSTGTVEYNIYRKVILGTTSPVTNIQTNPGNLYFGASDSTHDGKSAPQRYVAGSLSYIYVK